MASQPTGGDDVARIRQQLSPPPFPLVGPTAWSGRRYLAGWGGNDHEVQRVTLGHVSSGQQQLYIETARWPHPTTSARLAHRDGAPPTSGPPIEVALDGGLVELARVPVWRWEAEYLHGVLVAPWAGVGRVGGDGPDGVEFSVEALGVEPADVALVVAVDIDPYPRTSEGLEQRRFP